MSSSRYALINSDFKLTRVDVIVMKQFKKLRDNQQVSVKDLYYIMDTEISIHSVRAALTRLAVREYLKVTRVIQISKHESWLYYQLDTKGRTVLKFHVDLQNET